MKTNHLVRYHYVQQDSPETIKMKDDAFIELVSAFFILGVIALICLVVIKEYFKGKK